MLNRSAKTAQRTWNDDGHLFVTTRGSPLDIFFTVLNRSSTTIVKVTAPCAVNWSVIYITAAIMTPAVVCVSLSNSRSCQKSCELYGNGQLQSINGDLNEAAASLPAEELQ